MKKTLLCMLLCFISSIQMSYAKTLPVIATINPNYIFKFHNYPNDVEPFLRGLMRGDREIGVELQYRLTMDVAINAQIEINEAQNPLNQLIGINFENVFGETKLSSDDINLLAKYLAFSLARQAKLEAELAPKTEKNLRTKSFSMMMPSSSPFSLFFEFWIGLSSSAYSFPYFNNYASFFPLFPFPAVSMMGF